MKVALLYPPPWKIPEDGAAERYGVDGPPPEYKSGDLDADFYQIPYGLLQLGAEAMRAGHQVKVLNLSSFTWPKVEEILDVLDADVYGLSCWTANRRGVAIVSTAIKMRQPDARVVIGGPHATPFAKEMLAHHGAIDAVSTGESDITFLEILDAVAANKPLSGIAGTIARDGDAIVVGAKRPSVKDLDDLAPVHAYFDTHIMMTSRGCPWACTFCGAETSWGRGFRSHSNDFVLDELARSVERLPVKMIQIKDDTFTTNKKRVLELCRSIRERKLSFFWSCDTRVDLLSEELLREMRLAGCQRLSLGVESGSQRILDAIDKKFTPDEIIASTELAKKVGIKVRYYMMLGNRGETAETFRETLAFLDRARPHEYVFSCLSVYPGTRDFSEAERAGWLDREVYFKETFQELKTPFDASDEDAALMNEWFSKNSGLRPFHKPTVEEYRSVLELLGDYHAAHMDLSGALLEQGDLDGAEYHVRRALELGYPCPGLGLNALAVIASKRRDYETMKDLFMKAAKTDPQHYALIRNVNAARAWFKEGGPDKGLELTLEARHDFQLLERTVQPTLPGPLPADFATWSEPLKAEPAPHYVKTPDIEGSKRDLGSRGKLKVVS
ncbi:MAG: radical SAM protein [Polyangiaceae bacterium]|nr:radical SAM protein [Polyangiaceae bacterium]